VGTPKAMLRSFEAHLTEKDWKEVQAGVEVKLVPVPDGQETFIVARSADRREKEKAMHDRFIERFERGLQKLQASMESGRLRDTAAAHQRIGRLKERYWRAAGAFEVKITPKPSVHGKPGLSIAWSREARWSEWAAMSDGCYLLRTNVKETDAGVLWKRYIQLTDAEWAFRITKDELALRPIWHQKAERVKAHILVCFLAYVLWKTLAQWMRGAGLGDAPRTLVEEIAKIKSGDVMLPARLADGSERVIGLRCVTTPDEAQKVLLHRLGLQLPQRLRRVDEMERM
jgi:hypothetical protein